jgi:hypothetical protein
LGRYLKFIFLKVLPSLFGHYGRSLKNSFLSGKKSGKETINCKIEYIEFIYHKGMNKVGDSLMHFFQNQIRLVSFAKMGNIPQLNYPHPQPKKWICVY